MSQKNTMISKAQTADEPLGPTLKADILSCYGALCKLSSLDPSPQVNALFGELVGLCRQTPNEVTTDMVSAFSLCFLHLSFLFLASSSPATQVR